ncbi:MAG: porin family protein [Gemmatimonadales bacterium]
MRLRTLITVLTCSLGAPAAVLAQSIGIKAGLSFGDISHKGVLPDNLKTRTGFAAGIYVGSGGLIGFGAEGLYAQRGLDENQAVSEQEVKLDYIDVPVYLKITLPTPTVQPFGYAGPQLSYEVRCRTASGGDCADAGQREKWDYAAVIGAGIRIKGFGIEGRYVYGLRDLKLSTITSEESYQTRSFLILASIGR